MRLEVVPLSEDSPEADEFLVDLVQNLVPSNEVLDLVTQLFDSRLELRNRVRLDQQGNVLACAVVEFLLQGLQLSLKSRLLLGALLQSSELHFTILLLAGELSYSLDQASVFLQNVRDVAVSLFDFLQVAVELLFGLVAAIQVVL